MKPLWAIERELEKAREYEQALRVKSRQRSLHAKSIRVPATDTLLRKSGNKWAFGSEKVLEDFVWGNLTSLLGLIPLERQYSVNGEYCDILARDTNKQLVVLELKNSEDRGIVQQLTRYYVNLMGYKPFKSEVDYSKPVRLFAIMPSFHRHNLIDREYSKLNFEFFRFDVIQEKIHFFLKLRDINTDKVFQIQIQPSEEDVWDMAGNLPDPPINLKKIIGQCPSEIQTKILRIRELILCFHERIQEMTAPGVIKYGRGKSKICAEIRLDKSSNRPLLYLYLPIPDKRRARPIDERRSEVSYQQPRGRMLINTNDWNNIQLIQYIPPTKRGALKLYNFNNFEHYAVLTEVTSQFNPIDVLIDIALENWLERL